MNAFYVCFFYTTAISTKQQLSLIFTCNNFIAVTQKNFNFFNRPTLPALLVELLNLDVLPPGSSHLMRAIGMVNISSPADKYN